MISFHRLLLVLALGLLGLAGCGYNSTLLADDALAKLLEAIGTQTGNSFVTHVFPSQST